MSVSIDGAGTLYIAPSCQRDPSVDLSKAPDALRISHLVDRLDRGLRANALLSRFLNKILQNPTNLPQEIARNLEGTTAKYSVSLE